MPALGGNLGEIYVNVVSTEWGNIRVHSTYQEKEGEKVVAVRGEVTEKEGEKVVAVGGEVMEDMETKKVIFFPLCQSTCEKTQKAELHATCSCCCCCCRASCHMHLLLLSNCHIKFFMPQTIVDG